MDPWLQEALSAEAVGYLEAWQRWWVGQKLEGLTMWGLPMLWWARLGKLLQFIGGAVVVLDLIGPDRIRRFASWLREGGKDLTGKKYGMWRSPRKLLRLFILGLLLSFPLSYLIELAWLQDFETNAAALASGVIAGLIVAFSGHYLVRAIAQLVQLGKHKHGAQWAAFTIVVLGFHFDLLGS